MLLRRVEVVPFLLDQGQRAEGQRGLRASRPPARLRELDRAAGDSSGAAKVAANQLEPGETSHARQLRVGHLCEPRRIERLGQVDLGLRQLLERHLGQPEVAKRDRAHRLAGLR
jgi:hypothetical protein